MGLDRVKVLGVALCACFYLCLPVTTAFLQIPAPPRAPGAYHDWLPFCFDKRAITLPCRRRYCAESSGGASPSGHGILSTSTTTLKGLESDALDKVATEIEGVVLKIEEAERELERAMRKGDKEDIQYWREKEKQLREKEKQLRDKEKVLLDLQLKDQEMRSGTGLQGVGQVDSGIDLMKQSLPTLQPTHTGIFPHEGCDYEYGIIKLPCNATFVNLKVPALQQLFIRPWYKPLAEKIQSLRDRYVSSVGGGRGTDAAGGVVVSGTPGIGKSVGFLNYLMWLAAKAGKIVVFESVESEKTWVFDFAKARAPAVVMAGRPTEVAVLGDCETWYLMDPAGVRGAGREPLMVKAFTVVAASPNPTHFGQFLKREGIQYILPAWSEDELHLFSEHVWPDLSLAERASIIKRRYRELGGVPRYVYASEEKYRRGVRDLDGSLTEGALSLFTSWRNLRSDNYEKQKHRIFHAFTALTGEEAYEAITLVRPASARVEAKLEDAMDQIIEDKDLALLERDSSELATFIGRRFERLALKAIARMGSDKGFPARLIGLWDPLKGRVLTPPNSTEFAFHVDAIREFKDLTEVELGPYLYKPENNAFPSIDALVATRTPLGTQLTLIQAKRFSGNTWPTVKLEGVITVCRHFGLLEGCGERPTIDVCLVQPPGSYRIKRSWSFVDKYNQSDGDAVVPLLRQWDVCVDLLEGKRLQQQVVDD